MALRRKKQDMTSPWPCRPRPRRRRACGDAWLRVFGAGRRGEPKEGGAAPYWSLERRQGRSRWRRTQARDAGADQGEREEEGRCLSTGGSPGARRRARTRRRTNNGGESRRPELGEMRTDSSNCGVPACAACRRVYGAGADVEGVEKSGSLTASPRFRAPPLLLLCVSSVS